MFICTIKPLNNEFFIIQNPPYYRKSQYTQIVCNIGPLIHSNTEQLIDQFVIRIRIINSVLRFNSDKNVLM